MSLYNIEIGHRVPDAAEALRVIGAIVADCPAATGHRVVATADSRAPAEGLALLTAYVTIEDRRVRQAVLDLLVMIAAKAP